MEPERCAECGFDATLLMTADAITALRSLGRRWREAFEDVPDDVLRRRPDPQTWSPLEYAAHTRDVLALLGQGLSRSWTTSVPSSRRSSPTRGRRRSAADHGYNALDPERVLNALERNANGIADRAARHCPSTAPGRPRVGGDDASTPGGSLKHAVHDATHHLKDVQRALGRLTGGRWRLLERVHNGCGAGAPCANNRSRPATNKAWPTT